jgi:hypothetical protein
VGLYSNGNECSIPYGIQNYYFCNNDNDEHNFTCLTTNGTSIECSLGKFIMVSNENENEITKVSIEFQQSFHANQNTYYTIEFYSFFYCNASSNCTKRSNVISVKSLNQLNGSEYEIYSLTNDNDRLNDFKWNKESFQHSINETEFFLKIDIFLQQGFVLLDHLTVKKTIINENSNETLSTLITTTDGNSEASLVVTTTTPYTQESTTTETMSYTSPTQNSFLTSEIHSSNLITSSSHSPSTSPITNDFLSNLSTSEAESSFTKSTTENPTRTSNQPTTVITTSTTNTTHTTHEIPLDDSPKVPLLVISLDGFQAAKLDEYISQNPDSAFNEIKKSGVKAEYMEPSFPTLTFPNHITLVTGLNIESHGIVGNTFYDPQYDLRVNLIGGSNANEQQWWNQSEPIWLTAKKQVN